VNSLAQLFLAVFAAAGMPVHGALSPETVAQYSAADRTQWLIAGAKKEGKLVIYTSAQSEDLGPVVQAFEKKYGIKVSVWRSGSENVLQRVLAEARGKRFTVDVVETNGPELEALHREKLLVKVKSPYFADLIPEAIRPHREWVGTRLNVFVQAYNSRLVSKADLPKTWEELADPKWKGKLGIEAEDMDWLAGVLAEVGESQGTETFKRIVAANGMSVRKGHTLLAQLVASGEVPLALTVYNYKAEQLKAKGAPIDWFVIGTAIARPNGIGMARHAPNPHAAALFYDFELSEEGQRLLAARDFLPTNRKVGTPFSGIPLRFVDAGVTLDEGMKWTALYDYLFVQGRGR